MEERQVAHSGTAGQGLTGNRTIGVSSCAMKANDIVKYSKPRDDEEAKLRFILLRDPEKGRADIQLICDYRIKPIETVEVAEIEPAD